MRPRSFIATDTGDYALVRAGGRRRLERIGSLTISRPEPQAIGRAGRAPAVDWNFNAELDAWQFRDPSTTEGKRFLWHGMQLELRPTPFRHIGVFPEQAVHWASVAGAAKGRGMRLLNLFGYTGALSIAASLSGAEVTHVDASKPAVSWAADNGRLSRAQSVRWIVEDARKFVAREIRRGATYDGIVLDPPVFGRGDKGETWRLREDLPGLLEGCRQLLGGPAPFLILTAYATDLGMLNVASLVRAQLPALREVEYGPSGLQDETGNPLQTGFSIVACAPGSGIIATS